MMVATGPRALLPPQALVGSLFRMQQCSVCPCCWLAEGTPRMACLLQCARASPKGVTYGKVDWLMTLLNAALRCAFLAESSIVWGGFAVQDFTSQLLGVFASFFI